MDNTIVNLQKVSKSFGEVKAVNGVSLDIGRGEMFGLIGPNGSGKTTIIRIIMGILEPDVGEIRLFGGKHNGDVKNLIGYLPEERGLYSDLTVSDTIGYLASLKGMDGKVAIEKANGLLKYLGQPLDNKKKIKELSHGMAQLVQLVVAVVHNPDLVILDEPFSGLDPIKIELFKDVIRGLNAEGKTVLLSTHRMGEVEALCSRIFMIDRGSCVLSGGLREIKERYDRGIVRFSVDGDVGELLGVARQYEQNGFRELVLKPQVSPEDILSQLLARGVRVREFAVKLPSLQEIFVEMAGGK